MWNHSDIDARPGGGLLFCAALIGSPTSNPEAIYTVFSRPDGTGFSTAGALALTTGSRPEPGGRDGLLVFVRDLDQGTHWRVGAPAAGSPSSVWYENGVFILTQEHDGIGADLRVCVIPGRAAELRLLTLTNRSASPRRLDVTSLAEIALNSAAAHAAHPGFSKLFVQTEALPEHGTLLARRRPRSPDDHCPQLVHVLAGEGPLEWETDRVRWRGRARHQDEPRALDPGAKLEGTTGNVLDPVASLRRAVTLEPGATATFTLLLGAATDRAAAIGLAELANDAAAVAAAFVEAHAAAGADLAQRGWNEADDLAARDLAAAILCGDPALRARPEVLARAAGTPWLPPALSSGADEALVVAHLDTVRPEALARLTAQYRLWRDLGLPIRLVLTGDAAHDVAVPDGAIRLAADDLDAAARDRLDASAAMVVSGDLPSPSPAWAAPALPRSPMTGAAGGGEAPPAEDLQFFNGVGGFSADGREYVIRLAPDANGRLLLPPLPWTNVMANERFGFLVSETGAGYGLVRQQPREPADAVEQRPGPRSAGRGALPARRGDRTVLVLPARPLAGGGAYEVRHGFGYSRYRREPRACSSRPPCSSTATAPCA